MIVDALVTLFAEFENYISMFIDTFTPTLILMKAK